MRRGSVRRAGSCILIEASPIRLCDEASPAAARSSANTPSPAPPSPWQAAQFWAKSRSPSEPSVVLDSRWRPFPQLSIVQGSEGWISAQLLPQLIGRVAAIVIHR
jgi:hypothetical protein